MLLLMMLYLPYSSANASCCSPLLWLLLLLLLLMQLLSGAMRPTQEGTYGTPLKCKCWMLNCGPRGEQSRMLTAQLAQDVQGAAGRTTGTALRSYAEAALPAGRETLRPLASDKSNSGQRQSHTRAVRPHARTASQLQIESAIDGQPPNRPRKRLEV